MVRRFILGTAAMSAVISMQAQAKTNQETFLPENNLYLQDSLERISTLTQDDFNAVIAKVKVVVDPIVVGFGGHLTVNARWTDSTVNANASQSGTAWTVNMYGGLARRSEVTIDGFTMVLCHELGHHLGGFPFVSSWAADEGQADYFATTHCAHLVWGNDTAANAASRDVIPAAPKAQCDEMWSTQDAQNLCYRTMMAGKSLGDLLAALGGDSVSFTTPDTSVVSSTNHDHPAAQCRLDTYMAGAACTQDWDHSTIPGKNSAGRNDRAGEEASAQYYCASRDNYAHGARPTCWFHPAI